MKRDGGLRIIEAGQITEAVAKLCIDANTCMGADILAAMKKARADGSPQLAQSVIDTLLENAEIASREKLPICQDTGMAVVFVTIGSDVHISGDIDEAVNEGVRQGYRKAYFRNSVVRDPIDRVNTGDNTPAVVHYGFVAGDSICITVAPKGFGSENMSGVRMLNPSDGIEGVEGFVLETIRAAGPNPCPPIIVGVGVGGTMEKAALLSKQALLREVGSMNENPYWAGVEGRLLAGVNALGIGPAGFGGSPTALGVHIMAYPTHIAGLPVAVNIGCHATRHRTMVL